MTTAAVDDSNFTYRMSVHLQHPLVHLHLPGGHVHDAPSQPLQTQGQHPPWQLSPH